MRLRLLVSTISFLLLLVLIGTPAVQAQTQSLAERNWSWDSRTVIGLPGDEDDEGDDEASDCPPYPAPVAATGQTECWNDFNPAVFQIDCAGTGQDGEYQVGVSVDPRFTDNLDGTVTDNLTGLVWLQSADCFGDQDWTNALSIANTLAGGSCGLTDGSVAGNWRLPNVKELQSLIDWSQHGPALPFGHPFSGVQWGYYWSSSYEAYNPSNAVMVAPRTGHVNATAKAFPNWFWPVRGPE